MSYIPGGGGCIDEPLFNDKLANCLRTGDKTEGTVY